MPRIKKGSKVKPNDPQQAQIEEEIAVYNNLVARRDALTNQINRFQIFSVTKCTVLDNPVLEIDLKARLCRIEAMLDDFENSQQEIEQMCQNNNFKEADEQKQECEDFENLYYSNISNAKLILEQINALHVGPQLFKLV
ncbi:unnamed protein product [Ceutorhynchus assimilis]|uniref:Uncharacterized protein n=1 Tax=Ceutorhynchus assimilis TaxID=467358 RepID=A0A9N9QRF7_9CUCU|nr:unnamed protein product [Ceutorhynchus assimilis]